jgi:hypothetical protein
MLTPIYIIFAVIIVLIAAQWAWTIFGIIKQPTQSEYTPKTVQPQSDIPIIDLLINRIKQNGIAWVVIGIVQFVGSVLWFGETLRRAQIWWFVPFLITIEGIKNIARGYKDVKFSGRLWHTPTGIVKRYKTPAAAAEAFIDNIIFGAVMGLVGCIMLQKIRRLVKKNITELQQIENEFIRKQNESR